MYTEKEMPIFLNKFISSFNAYLQQPNQNLLLLNNSSSAPLFCIIPANHLCMLSHFRSVRLFVTLWTSALQAPQSIRFSRQEYWRVLPCPPPGDLPYPVIEPAAPAAPALREDSSLISLLEYTCLKQHIQEFKKHIYITLISIYSFCFAYCIYWINIFLICCRLFLNQNKDNIYSKIAFQSTVISNIQLQ